MVKRVNERGNFCYILKLALEPKLWFVVFIPIFAIILGQKEVITSWLSAQIFNKLQYVVEGDRDISLLNSAVFFSCLLFFVNIIEWMISTISDLIENFWREHVNLKLQKIFLHKDYRIDISDYDNPDLISRRSVAQGVDPVGQIKTYITGISRILASVTFAIVLWQYSPIMFFIALTVKIPLGFIVNKINRDNRNFQIDTGVINREKNYFKNIPIDRATTKEFKIFNFKNYVCEKYDRTVEKFYKLFKGKYIKNVADNSFLEHFDLIVIIVIQIIIGFSVFAGEMLFGNYILLIAAFKNVTGSFDTIVRFVAQCKDMHTQNNMLREYLEDHSVFESGEKNDIEAKNMSHSFEFKDVSFTYPGTDKEILHNLNLTISAGKTHGLVGLNGSGKSTLVNLLLRLYEPDSGEILLDGVNIKEYNIHSYYEAIACVFQSTTHYAMPIRDYISAGKPCDIDKVQAAIRQVKLDTWCDELPYGLDTMLTRAFTSETDSVEPSIGQWQKLSIARAIYKDAPIMILDEPSASLDVDSENEIFNYITQLTVKKTAILISHRLSNIIGCDHIFVLQDGCLVEQGNHQTLLEMGGVYANLFNSQAKYYKAE